MSPLIEWNTIALRIRSLLQAGSYFAQMLANNSSDSYKSSRSLLDQSGKIFQELNEYKSKYSKLIPQRTNEALQTFLREKNQLFLVSEYSKSTGIELVKARLTMLAALESEITFLLTDTQEQVRRQSELAFTHLQRSIMADPSIKEKWNKAFSDGEVACEKLGSVHLLQHGIWAFKVDAAGGRTDLILGEPLTNVAEVERAASGLVLTEWKLAKKDSDAEKMFVAARTQASKYGVGILAGVELTDYRFVVVVTNKNVPEPNDVFENAIKYRHINIAVNPQTPSKK